MSIYYTECPYCEKETEIEIESKEQNEVYKIDCIHCSKIFEYYFEIGIEIYPSKLKGDK